MSYYDDPKNVEEYIRLADGYDGRALVDLLCDHLPAGSTVLELGMGPGKDLEMLSEHFEAIGSDSSSIFLDRYRQQHPDADLLQLDARTLETDRRFDCIYSNKVLHHLAALELSDSLDRQWTLLNPGGLLLHALWYGDGEETHGGMRFFYYDEASFGRLFAGKFAVVKAQNMPKWMRTTPSSGCSKRSDRTQPTDQGVSP